MPDKFTATWISHSSISDYIACPRAYYLKNVHKDPGTSYKINLMAPALALGQAVHEQLEALSVLPVEQRVLSNLVPQFQKAWEKYSGEKGGFAESKQERQLGKFDCPYNGCRKCELFERIIKGQGKDMYILSELGEEDVEEVIL